MIPPGNITGRFKPVRVGSSTCSRPGMSQDGTVTGVVSELAQEMPYSLTGPEVHVLSMVEQGSISYQEAYHAIESL